MQTFTALFSLALLTGAFTTPALPTGSATFHLDQEESVLTFEVRKLGFLSETGQFARVEAMITAAGDTLETVHMQSTIDVTSISVSSDEMRERLLSESWFNADNYPKAQFDCDKIQLMGDRQAIADGELTIRGITQPTVFIIDFKEDVAKALTADERISFHATGSFSRSAFGMTKMSGLVGDTVELDFIGHFQREVTPTEFPE